MREEQKPAAVAVPSLHDQIMNLRAWPSESTMKQFDNPAVAYKLGHRDARHAAAELAAAAPQPPVAAQEPKRVFLVATGELHEGEETYTRHDDAPPPLCDAECLYTHPATQPAPVAQADAAYTELAEKLQHGAVAIGSDGEWVSIRRYVRDEAVAALRASRGQAPAEIAADILERIAEEPPINGNSLATARVLMAAQALRDQPTTTQPAPVAQGDALTQAARDVLAEVERATRKFPTWPTDPLHALAVLGEEFGELTKDMLQLTYEPHKTSTENVRTEAMQTAAMALRLYMSLERYEYKACEQHSQAKEGASNA